MTIEQLDKIEWLTRAFHADLKANALLAVQEQERKMMLSLGVGEGKISRDRKSTRLNSSHSGESRMPSSA